MNQNKNMGEANLRASRGTSNQSSEGFLVARISSHKFRQSRKPRWGARWAPKTGNRDSSSPMECHDSSLPERDVGYPLNSSPLALAAEAHDTTALLSANIDLIHPTKADRGDHEKEIRCNLSVAILSCLLSGFKRQHTFFKSVSKMSSLGEE